MGKHEIDLRKPAKLPTSPRAEIRVSQREASDCAKLEKSLADNRNFLNSLIESILDAVVILDWEGNILFANPAAFSLVGLDPSRGIDELNIFRFVQPDDRRKVEHHLDLVRRDEGGFFAEYGILTCDGCKRWVEVIGRKIFFEGRDSDLVTIRDITDRKLAEKALRESEERYGRIVSAITDYIYTAHVEHGRLVRTEHNPACVAVTGYTAEEFSSDPHLWINMVHEDDRGRVREHGRKLLSGEDVSPIEHRIRRKDGSVRWVRNTPVMYRDASGVLVSIDGVVRDITEHKLAEEELRESEIRFRTLHEASFGGIGIHDRGVILDCNQGLSDISGYSRSELIGMDGLLLIAPAWRDFVMRKILSGFDRPYDVEGIRKDGSVYPLEIQGKNIPYHGRMARVTEFRDITERKRAEKALRESEERFRGITGNLPGVVYQMYARRNGEIGFYYVSVRSLEILGLESAPEHFFTSLTEHIAPEDRQRFISSIHESIETSGRWDFEGRYIRPDGKEMYVRGISQPEKREDELVFNGVLLDVTARIKAEKERIEIEKRFLHAQRLESLGLMAGGIAHDFNNLLTAILGNLDLALAEPFPGSSLDSFIRKARSAAHRAADLTNQLLAYSGKGKFDNRVFDLSALVEEMTGLLEVSIPKNVRLSLSMDRSLPLITADPGQIQQIIMNLIVNASESMDGKPGTVFIATGKVYCDEQELQKSRLEEKPSAGDFIFLEVRDSGCGMDEQTRERLFDPFFSTKFTGRGLGMAAVLGIVRGHRGAIMVESEPGTGTMVRVLLPAGAGSSKASASGGATATAEQVIVRKSISSETILVVDDEEIVLDLCRTMLAHLGYRVLTAENGEEALERIHEHGEEIACVILDLTMPGMNGIDAFQAIKRMRGGIRVIMSSGFSEQEVSHLFGGASPEGFLKKPYELKSLRSEIERVLSKARPRTG
ncbi:MAG TPA: PAS domain S-box protein [Desulfomonilia bacterium]|nr:PAS domain S-box protein [Desulfomonilia bacterium]